MEKEKTLGPFVWLLPVALQLCSIRPVFKYLPYPVACYGLILILSSLSYYGIINFFLRRKSFLDLRALSVVLISLIFAVSMVMYPKADALKYRGAGSDADDAVIVAATKLAHGQFPYGESTYLHHPISPGPGILFFMLPFVLTKAYFAAIPFFVIAFAAFCFKLSGEIKMMNLILLLIVSSFGLWEYLIIGSDLIVVSILIAIFGYLSISYSGGRVGLLAIGLMTGIVLSSRITLIYLVPVISYIVFKKNHVRGVIFGLSALATCFFTHYIFFYNHRDGYSPFHLIQKGHNSIHIPVLIIGLLANLILSFVFLRQKSFSTTSGLKYIWLFAAVPHLFIGISMVITDRYLLSYSEGPGYLLIAFFPFLIYFCSVYKPFTQVKSITRIRIDTHEPVLLN